MRFMKNLNASVGSERNGRRSAKCSRSRTGFNNGIPCLLLIASASRSGPPGISGPLVPGAGFGIAEDLYPVVDLFFEFSLVDEAVNLHSPATCGQLAGLCRKHQRCTATPCEASLPHEGSSVAPCVAVRSAPSAAGYACL